MRFWTLLKQAFAGWKEDRVASMGAALAYYTAFSIAPLLIIAIAVAGLFFGRDAAQGAIVAQIGSLIGETGGEAIEQMLRSNSDFGSGALSLALGIGALLLGATTAFVELQDDLDRIWKAPPRVGSGIVNFIRARMLSSAWCSSSDSCLLCPSRSMRQLPRWGVPSSRKRKSCFKSRPLP